MTLCTGARLQSGKRGSQTGLAKLKKPWERGVTCRKMPNRVNAPLQVIFYYEGKPEKSTLEQRLPKGSPHTEKI